MRKRSANKKLQESIDDKVDHIASMIDDLYITTNELKDQKLSFIKTEAGLIEITELSNFLGYEDYRSIVKWLRQQMIPIIDMGKKSYIKYDLLKAYIESKVTVTAQPITNNVRSLRGPVRHRRVRSKAAADFLKDI